MISKVIMYFGRQAVLACDARCDKAWGINARPRVQLSDDPNDYAFRADHELGTAPVDPGTYEGGHAKPASPERRLNKWCARECERSILESLPNFSAPRPNLASRVMTPTPTDQPSGEEQEGS